SLTVTTGNYSFYIDLTQSLGDAWLVGNNSYTLIIRTFNDTDESYVNLSKQIRITTPTNVLDIVAGTRPTGNAAWGDNDYAYYYENDNYWTRVILAAGPRVATAQDDVRQVFAIAFGDLDDDDDKDVVVGCEADRVYIYDNDGYWTRYVVDPDTGDDVLAVALGDLDGDTDLDIVAGTDDRYVYYYLNDGIWDRSGTIANTDGIVLSLALANLTGDSKIDVAVATDAGISVYENPTWTKRWSANIGRVNSVALADMDYPQDGKLDIVAGLENRKVILYLNKGDGSFGGTVGGEIINDTVYAEIAVLGNITGTYINTTSSNNDYEKITEAPAPTIIDTKPSEQVSGSSGSINDIKNDDNQYYPVNKNGRWVQITSWDTADLVEPFTKVELKVAWYTETGYTTNDYIKWDFDGGTDWKNAIQITASTVETTASFDLRAQGIDTISEIAGLEVYFKNNEPSNGKDVYFDYWWIEVTFGAGPYQIEHKWKLAFTGSSPNIYIEAHRSEQGSDYFEFMYSTDDVTYNPFSTPIIINKTLDDNQYNSSALTGLSGTIYIRVRDTNRTDDNDTRDTLYVDHIYISSTATASSYITVHTAADAVKSVSTGDIDGAYGLDIVAGIKDGNIYYFKNPGTSPPVSWIAVFVDNPQGSSGWIHSVVVGNVNAILQDDIVASTDNGMLYLYHNRGYGNSWRRVTVDNLELTAGGRVPIYCLAIGDASTSGKGIP
ncbi:MAG: hypothetical protein AB1779_07445, partial [Candidatus Thermoplasmatota archaeon]